MWGEWDAPPPSLSKRAPSSHPRRPGHRRHGCKGFTRYVEAGDIVSAGQPILSFDDEAIKAAGHDDVVTCVVSNPQELDEVHAIGSSSTLLGGRPLVKVGDPLIVTK